MRAKPYYCSTRGCRLVWKNVQWRTCRACRGTNTRRTWVEQGKTVAVIPDFPEHYNISFGQVVRNRAHYKQLQREKGTQDWEPCRNSPGSILSTQRAVRRERVMSTVI